MVVDDEEFCLTMMRTLLFNCGIDVDHRVDFFMSGQEAIEQIKQVQLIDARYQLIFTDFNMPIMNGIEMIKKMRKYFTKEQKLSKKDQPIIIGVTGHVQD